MEPGTTTTRHPARTGGRNIRLVVAYDGSPYLGWQIQPHGPTIQSVLQESIRRVTGEIVLVKGSGRTDAGVHALGQVANFHTWSSMPPGQFMRALNSVLPPTITIQFADEVEESFDAQFSAIGKLYRYRVFNSRCGSPFEIGRSWHVNRSIDLESMSASASILLGKHDFSSFRSSGCVAKSPVRIITRCAVEKNGTVITFELEANGFLRHMVRNIVGTLVDVGRGRFSTADFSRILMACDRRRAGIAAPPHGLYLVRVDYPADPDPRVPIAKDRS